MVLYSSLMILFIIPPLQVHVEFSSHSIAKTNSNSKSQVMPNRFITQVKKKCRSSSCLRPMGSDIPGRR